MEGEIKSAYNMLNQNAMTGAEKFRDVGRCKKDSCLV